MRRSTFSALFAGLLALGWILAYESPSSAAQSSANTSGVGVSGQGKYRFRVLYTSTHLPAEAQKVLTAAHGGFAIDRRNGKGETYFALPGAGIIQISPDLKNTRMIDTDAAMKNTNMHNTTIWHAPGGGSYLTFPGNQANQVFTTTLDGRLLHTLKTPDASTDLGHPTANEYFAGKGPFIPTDVEYLDGLLYVATGYSKLDFVLTARVTKTSPFEAAWYDLAFGGKGNGPGQFGTGHGITIPPGTRRVDIADRPNSEIDRFTRHGQYLSTLRLPAGSFPCDTFYHGNLGIVGALHGPDRTKGAPIYILEGDNVVSTIMPKEELGLKNFQHVHNAVVREVGNKLYVIAQAWNPGDFAILEQVAN
jgi:hypothetical protein